jgi:hypothetical protein
VQIVSTNPNQFGVIAVGQEAWGIIAIGQMARGFIVLGQLAVGVVGAGQCAAVVWGVGQVGLGVAWFTAMVGIGGRGYGGVLRLVPGLDPPRQAPDTVPLDDVMTGRASGHVRLQVVADGNGAGLGQNGAVLPIKLTPQVAGALDLHAPKIPEVFARLRRHGPVVLCDGLVEVPGLRSTSTSKGLLAARLLALVTIATVWWFIFANAVLLPLF